MNQEQRRKLAREDSRPMLIILPGLGGGSEEDYLRDMCRGMVENSKWEIVVVISRGCSRTALTSKLFYHAGSTWDLTHTISWLKELFPNRPLYAVGFSLGGNILTNYLADAAGACVLQAAMTISNPWNLEAALDSLQSSYFGRETYLRSLCSTLQRKVLANIEQVKAFRDIEWDAVRKAKYLHEFDAAVQVPMWGFASARDYYRKTSSVHRIASITIPFLGVNALDDPITGGKTTVPSLDNSKFAILCTTKHGGHVGWHRVGSKRWTTLVASSFFNEMRKWQLEKRDDVDS